MAAENPPRDICSKGSNIPGEKGSERGFVTLRDIFMKVKMFGCSCPANEGKTDRARRFFLLKKKLYVNR